MRLPARKDLYAHCESVIAVSASVLASARVTASSSVLLLLWALFIEALVIKVFRSVTTAVYRPCAWCSAVSV